MKSVVLLSGGVDSTVALAVRKDLGDEIYTVSVNYGQTHHREIDAAQEIARYYGVPHTEIDIRGALSGSALTGHAAIPDGHADAPDATLVPGRNLVLLSLATARAQAIGAGAVVIGANADDAGGYPDCRRGFIESYRDTVSLATEGRVWISAPLLSMTKTEIVAEGYDLGAPLYLTYSCYRGKETTCGKCGACKSRIEAEWNFELSRQ